MTTSAAVGVAAWVAYPVAVLLVLWSRRVRNHFVGRSAGRWFADAARPGRRPWLARTATVFALAVAAAQIALCVTAAGREDVPAAVNRGLAAGVCVLVAAWALFVAPRGRQKYTRWGPPAAAMLTLIILPSTQPARAQADPASAAGGQKDFTRLLAQLNAPSPGERAAALLAIKPTDDFPADRVMELVDDPDDAVATAAVRALEGYPRKGPETHRLSWSIGIGQDSRDRSRAPDRIDRRKPAEPAPRIAYRPLGAVTDGPAAVTSVPAAPVGWEQWLARAANAGALASAVWLAVMWVRRSAGSGLR
jgi:hypothetical protein